MKIKILIGVLVFLILVNLATIGSFLVMVSRGKPPAPFPEDRPGRFTREPFNRDRQHRMSPELRSQLRDNFRALNSETSDLRASIHELEAQTFELMQNDPVPIAQIDSILEEISRARLEISRIAIRNMLNAGSQLTPEERTQFFNALRDLRPDMPGPPRHGRNRDDRQRMHRRYDRGTPPESLQ